MAEETRGGEAEPAGEVLDAAVDTPVVETPQPEPETPPTVFENNEPDSTWPITGEEEFMGDEEPEESTGPNAEEPEPNIAPTSTVEPPPQAVPDYERLFKSAMEYIQATRGSTTPPSGQTGTAQPGNMPNQVPSSPVPGVGHEPISPPDSIEAIAAENNTTVDDPLVQRIYRQGLQLYESRMAQQQALQPLVADYYQRQAQQANWDAFNTWVATQCPPERRPTNADEHQQVFMDFTRLAAGRQMTFHELQAIRDWEIAQRQQPVQKARQEGYEQALKQKQKIAAASVASGKPTTRQTAPPRARSFREFAQRDNPSLSKR